MMLQPPAWREVVEGGREVGEQWQAVLNARYRVRHPHGAAKRALRADAQLRVRARDPHHSHAPHDSCPMRAPLVPPPPPPSHPLLLAPAPAAEREAPVHGGAARAAARAQCPRPRRSDSAAARAQPKGRRVERGSRPERRQGCGLGADAV
eukprot:4137263-Prymnesium_polylepis.1